MQFEKLPSGPNVAQSFKQHLDQADEVRLHQPQLDKIDYPVAEELDTIAVPTRKNSSQTVIVATEAISSRPDWQSLGACLLSNLDWPFPKTLAETKEAKAICRNACLVRADCLEWSMRGNPETGIWGGYGPGVRIRIKKGRREHQQPSASRQSET